MQSLLLWRRLLLWILLWQLLLRLARVPGILTGLYSGTKWSAASLRRLDRIRRSDRPGRWRSLLRRRWRGRLSTPGIDRWNIVRRQPQGAGGYQDEQFRSLDIRGILAGQ